MKKSFLAVLLAVVCHAALAIETVPISGTIISPTDSHIRYTGRISFANPERPAWNFPGVQIIAAFEGTSLKMIVKPQSGYFMALCRDHRYRPARRPSPCATDVCHRGL